MFLTFQLKLRNLLGRVSKCLPANKKKFQSGRIITHYWGNMFLIITQLQGPHSIVVFYFKKSLRGLSSVRFDFSLLNNLCMLLCLPECVLTEEYLKFNMQCFNSAKLWGAPASSLFLVFYWNIIRHTCLDSLSDIILLTLFKIIARSLTLRSLTLLIIFWHKMWTGAASAVKWGNSDFISESLTLGRKKKKKECGMVWHQTSLRSHTGSGCLNTIMSLSSHWCFYCTRHHGNQHLPPPDTPIFSCISKSFCFPYPKNSTQRSRLYLFFYLFDHIHFTAMCFPQIPCRAERRWWALRILNDFSISLSDSFISDVKSQ